MRAIGVHGSCSSNLHAPWKLEGGWWSKERVRNPEGGERVGKAEEK